MPSAVQMATVDDANCVSIVVPVESRVGPLVSCLVQEAGARRLLYTNRAPQFLGGGKAVLVADVSVETLEATVGSRFAREEGVVSIAATADVGAERFHVYGGKFGSSQRLELCMLGDIERGDFEECEPLLEWFEQDTSLLDRGH